MGFFNDLKEDLNQAVNELLPGDNQVEEQTAVPEESTLDTAPAAQAEEPTLQQLADLEQMLQNIAELHIEEETEDTAEEPAEEMPIMLQAEGNEPEAENQEILAAEGGQETSETTEESAGTMDITIAGTDLQETMDSLQETMQSLQGSLDTIMAQSSETAVSQAADGSSQKEELEEQLRATFGAPAGEETVEDYLHDLAIRTGADVLDKSWVLDLHDMEPSDETAIITAGMRVKGDILSNGSVDIIGEVIGNVQVTGKLNVTGKINGNAKAAEVFADAAKVHGDVISDGTIKIGAGTVVFGNIEASSAAIAGAVKGTIDVKGPVVLDATAVVLGNIRAKSMQINNGARIEGMCVLCYAEQSAAKFFENQENM